MGNENIPKNAERLEAQGQDFLVKESQCKNCINNIGKFDCTVYQTKPKEYQFVSYNKVCPNRNI